MATDTQPRDDFRQKLIFSAADKLVFGLLIVLAGFVLNLVLENHRADQAMKSEIARLRVQKVADMWQALDRHQQAVNQVGESEVTRSLPGFLRPTQPSPPAKSSYEKLDESAAALQGAPLTKQELLQQLFDDLDRDRAATERRYSALRRAQARLTARLNANRFWIGERIYPEYLEYANRQERLLQAYLDLSHTLDLTTLSPSATQGLSEAERSKLRADYDTGIRVVGERKKELDESRVDVFSAMERLS